MNIYLYIFLVTLSFLLYVEYTVGNIFYRMNSSGVYSFQPVSIISYLLESILTISSRLYKEPPLEPDRLAFPES